MIGVILEAIFQQTLIFCEHVVWIQSVLRCAEYKRPFSEALLVVGAIMISYIIFFVADGYFKHGLQLRAKPRLYQAMKEKLYEKASQIDITCYDDPDYYNEFVIAVSEADRIIMLEHGRIIEEGTHEELLDLCGKYVQMWKVQAGRYV